MDKEKLRSIIEENTLFTFARASGKGGQNVNKVNTKVHALLKVESVFPALHDETEKRMLFSKLQHKINAHNEISVSVDEERYQELNRRIAKERLFTWICNACTHPPVRKATQPTKASKEKRLLSKKMRSTLKKSRAYRGELCEHF